jgi:D-3-phosphoglycerate dehydrogenase / 2-oxoglutarate reductase
MLCSSRTRESPLPIVKILAAGDSYMPSRYFTEAFAGLRATHEIEAFDVDPVRPYELSSSSERSLREFQGDPAEIIEHMDGVEVLVVQGAPVTDRVLDASSVLRLVCCARGGPVNVDVEAASARGLPVVNTPGKNAEAVADLTLAFLVMLGRGLPKAQRFVEHGGRLRDNWDGAQFIGSDLRGHTLGIVGYGHVGTRVARRARPFGLSIVVYDPFARAEGDVEQVETLDELLGRAEFVSLHARATADTERMIDAAALAQMRPGAFLINTARESLIDENALDAALASQRLGGAALDVVEPTAEEGPHRLLRHENVVLTPHIGGATRETLHRGADMIAAEIERFADGRALTNVVNRAAVPA